MKMDSPFYASCITQVKAFKRENEGNNYRIQCQEKLADIKVVVIKLLFFIQIMLLEYFKT